MSDKREGGSVGIVLLAVLVALIIVFVGLGPMRQQFDEVGDRLRKKTTQFVETHKAWIDWIPRRPSLIPESKSFAIGDGTPVIDKKAKDLDKLSKKDKKELSSLINKLNQ